MLARSWALRMSQRFKVYTRTGDKGTSALYSGERRPKTDPVFEALGTTDELSSHLGMAREWCEKSGKFELIELDSRLQKIQCCLQDVGSSIATPVSEDVSRRKIRKTRFDEDGSLTTELEHWIDEMEAKMPPLRQFILPSGGFCASTLHVGRSVCRRAERRVNVLDSAESTVLKYVNRLSDFLFVSARYAAFVENKEVRAYTKVQPPMSPSSSSDEESS